MCPQQTLCELVSLLCTSSRGEVLLEWCVLAQCAQRNGARANHTTPHHPLTHSHAHPPSRACLRSQQDIKIAKLKEYLHAKFDGGHADHIQGFLSASRLRPHPLVHSHAHVTHPRRSLACWTAVDSHTLTSPTHCSNTIIVCPPYASASSFHTSPRVWSYILCAHTHPPHPLLFRPPLYYTSHTHTHAVMREDLGLIISRQLLRDFADTLAEAVKEKTDEGSDEMTKFGTITAAQV
jgi:hypothetical protein